MTPKPILFVEPLGAKYGTQVVLLDLVRRLNRKRFNPFVAFLNGGPFEEELCQLGIPTFILGSHRVRELHKVALAIYQLIKIIHNNKIQLVHGNGSTMLFYGGLAAQLTKRPFIWHVYDPHTDDTYARAFIAVQRHLDPSWTIFGTPQVNQYYLALYKQIKGYSNIFPGVNVDDVVFNSNAERARTRLGIPSAAPIVSVFARLQRYKGYVQLVEAAGHILRHHPEAFFVLCGGTQPGVEPSFPEELRRKIVEQRLEHRVLLTGYVSDAEKKDILAASTIVVHPALTEPFGISVIEGMAAGKPIVATDCIGPGVTVSHGETGLLVPRGDVGRLAEAIISLLDSPEQVQIMGERGKQRVLDNYTVTSMVQQVEHVYDHVLGSGTTNIGAGSRGFNGEDERN